MVLELDSPALFAYACALHPSMKGFAIRVEAGQSVTWANLGDQAHTATATDGAFVTGLVTHGKSASIEFDTPGVFAYLCTPHPWMKANIAVTPLAAEDLAATH